MTPQNRVPIGRTFTIGYPVESVVFSSDGSLLAVGTQNGGTRLLNLSAERTRNRVCASVAGYPTGDLWDRYVPASAGPALRVSLIAGPL